MSTMPIDSFCSLARPCLAGHAQNFPKRLTVLPAPHRSLPGPPGRNPEESSKSLEEAPGALAVKECGPQSHKSISALFRDSGSPVSGDSLQSLLGLETGIKGGSNLRKLEGGVKNLNFGGP